MGWSILRLLCLSVLAAALFGCRGSGSMLPGRESPTPEPSVSSNVLGETSSLLPPDDKLAYVSAGSAGWAAGDIWVLHSDGSRQRLTEDARNIAPCWSADGQWLLFLKDLTGPHESVEIYEPEYALWVARPDTDEVRELDAGPIGTFSGRPMWSPVDGRIAYIKGSPYGEEGDASLWLANPEDGSVEQILGPDFNPSDLAWSPDGQRIAVARYVRPDYVNVTPPEPVDIRYSPDSTLWVLSWQPDGSTDLERLFSRDELEEALFRALDETPQPGSAYGPTGVEGLTWSPQGDWLTFFASSLSASLSADGLPLFTVRSDGLGLTYHGMMLASTGLFDWSPEGGRLAVTLGVGRDVSSDKRIAVVEPGMSGAHVLTEDSDRSDAHPAWSPDGSRIAFQASKAGFISADVGKLEDPKEGIWVVDADGSNPRQLTADPDLLDFRPLWSADGEHILFVRTTGSEVEDWSSERAEIWLIGAGSEKPHALVTDLRRISSYYGLFRWDDLFDWYQAPLTSP
jgi:Tol biopolymer transport system component